MQALLRRFVNVRAEEVGALLWSFAYFFCVLCAYYILRPVRDGIVRGAANIPWMFTGTFVTMLAAVPLYAAVVARWPRRRFVPFIYHFFSLHLLAFFVALRSGLPEARVGIVFFIWLSVFNLFVVSVFWSVMADLWKSEQGKRLFGFIAAGGSAGGLVGPLLTARLVEPLGQKNLLLVSVVFLELAALCVGRLFRLSSRDNTEAVPALSAGGEDRIGGGVLRAFGLVFRSPYLLGICGQTILTTLTATVLYIQQIDLVSARIPDAAQRTALYAQLDFWVNALTIVLQALITGRLIAKAGLAVALGVVPAVTGLGFLGLALKPDVAMVIAFQGLRRVAHYAIERPAREILFTVVTREEKYKSKSFIDAVVFRGSDAVTSWIYKAVASLVSAATVSIAMIPLAFAWIALTTRLAHKQKSLSRAEQAPAEAALSSSQKEER